MVRHPTEAIPGISRAPVAAQLCTLGVRRRGCPVLVVEVPAGMDPSSLDLDEVLRDKRVKSKDGPCRRIWFRRSDARPMRFPR